MASCAIPANPESAIIYSTGEPLEGERVEFRLIYEGPLPPEKWSYEKKYARATDKHRLRKHFHVQLRELWNQHPDLRRQAQQLYVVHKSGPLDRRIEARMNPSPEAKTWVEHIADSHISCNGNRFVPLVSDAGGFTCALDILFLRRDQPGNLLGNAGDIDSRLKVLFDGLKMPKQVSELGGYTIDADEDPFYCLLEDDKLVTSVSVTTDRLISLPKEQSNSTDVMLVIHVTVVNPSALFAAGRLI